MNTANYVISKFSSMSSLSRALGHENPTTVQGWKERGIIPARQVPKVLEAAKHAGIALEPADFFIAANPVTTGEAA